MRALETISEDSLYTLCEENKWVWKKFDRIRKEGRKKNMPPPMDFKELNLTGRDLSGLFLRHADFSGSNLTGTILDKSDLSLALFSKTNLTGASLKKANLEWATMGDKTNLTDASLKEARLGGARIDAVLVNTDFTEAEFGDRSYIYPYESDEYHRNMTEIFVDHTALSAVFKNVRNFGKGEFYNGEKRLVNVAVSSVTGGLIAAEPSELELLLRRMKDKFNSIINFVPVVSMIDTLPVLQNMASEKSLPLEPENHNGTKHPRITRLSDHRP